MKYFFENCILMEMFLYKNLLQAKEKLSPTVQDWWSFKPYLCLLYCMCVCMNANYSHHINDMQFSGKIYSRIYGI